MHDSRQVDRPENGSSKRPPSSLNAPTPSLDKSPLRLYENLPPQPHTMSFETPNPPYNASDPYATFLSQSCFDLLLIELVPLAERMALHFESSLSTPTPTTAPDLDDKLRDGTYIRLESLGYRVGLGLSERFSRDRPRFTDNLDVIKFLCKDVWTLLFKKQIDNLKTNHRGVYVLTDNLFRPLARMSMVKREEAVVRAQPHLWFPCGVIRGALFALGINASVQAETAELPMATFQIKTLPPKS